MSTETMENDAVHAQEPDQLSDVLLVLDKEKMKIMAVKGIDKNGELETVDPNQKNQDQFMKVDKNGNLFSNFFSNFMSQLKNPSNFKFFKVPDILSVDTAEKMQVHLEKPNKEGEQLMSQTEVKMEPEKEQINQEQENSTKTTMEQTENNSEKSEYRFSPDQVDWETLSNLGWNQEKLEKYNLLDPLLKGYKTDKLVGVSLNLGTAILRTDARLSLQSSEDGKAIFVMHGIRKEPNLTQKFFGHEFTEEDKKNLLSTGNMGRVVELDRNGTRLPYIISIDRLTNDVIALKTESIKIPDEIKGIQLSQEQKNTLSEGKPLELTGMISRKNTPFDATIQYNADRRNLEYLFDRKPNNMQEKTQQQQQEQGIPQVFRGKEFSKDDVKQLNEGHTIYIEDFKDKKGQAYSGYVTLNKEKDTLGFSFSNPDKLKEQMVPSEAHKTQVAVNSEGKTNEATKKIEEPLSSAQNAPADKKQMEKQQSKIEEPEAPAKRRGRKM